MGLYRLFSYNVEIQYKSYLLSKATLFTLTTTALNIILPFLIAYRSRGFWLKSYHYYEQPLVRSTFDYLLVAETEDPSITFICGNEKHILTKKELEFDEQCMEVQIQEYDYNKDGKNDFINFNLRLGLPEKHAIISVILMLALDFHLMTICPLQMQTLAVISKEFTVPSSQLKYHGNLEFYQTSHLPCLRHHIDTMFNISLLTYSKDTKDNFVDFILENYFAREVTSQVKPIFVRSQHGHTGIMDIKLFLKIPEMKILYVPSILQEIKWAWPQYLSLVIVFYWIFNKIKRFVFNNRLLMAWEIVPWRKLD